MELLIRKVAVAYMFCLFQVVGISHFQVGTIIINGYIGHDPAEPGFERPRYIVGLNFREYLIKPLVHYFSGFLAVIGIAQAYAHSEAVICLIQHLLTTSVLFDTASDQLM